MKTCKRCNTKYNKKSTYCPVCGIEDGLKNYNYDKTKSYINGVPNPQRSSNYLMTTFFVIFGISFVSIFVLVFAGTFAIEKNFEKYSDIDEYDIYDIEKYTANVKLIAEDYYKVWTMSLSTLISKQVIVDNTSLSLYDLNNNNCNALEINPTTTNALKCVKTAHINNGGYKAAFNELEFMQFLIDNIKLNGREYRILSNIHLNAVALYNCITEENSYDVFETNYNKAITEIEILLFELNNENI